MSHNPSTLTVAISDPDVIRRARAIARQRTIDYGRECSVQEAVEAAIVEYADDYCTPEALNVY
jgi:hypothetical protein